MKKIILVGHTASGKTTLCQRLNGLDRVYKKTQAIEVVNCTIDTPGEYLEHRSFLRGLVVTSVETDLVLFIQDATAERFMFSPGQAASFPVPAVGVVTKTDIATEAQCRQAMELLELAGATPIFCVSAISGDGMDKLFLFLELDEPAEQNGA
ncbi:MAG: EutP/PduV family microcompartment system protein [Lawsonibacter sp.]|nr:EutP/PduV family microcompartment system protein [Lawsonibacter sp.]